MGVCENIFILALSEINHLWGVDWGRCLIQLHVYGSGVSRFVVGLQFSQDEKFFVGFGLGKVPDTTPYLWFWVFHIFIGLVLPRDKFILLAVVI